VSRILGVDLGTERTGLAIASFGVARPLIVIEAHDEGDIVAGIVRHASEQDAREIVFGLAISLKGTEGPAARRQRVLAQRVEKESGLQVHLWDERLTTAEAERTIVGSGADRQRRKEVVDMVAATLLLQNFIDARAARGEG